MKILITGIGCIGKSSLRECIASEFPDKVISVDMDYTNEIPSDKNKVVIIENVHGLEENALLFDKILYLLPPKFHAILWLRRGWKWFTTGIVDFSNPKGKMKKYAFPNIPIILKIIIRNIFMSRKWIRSDIAYIKNKISNNTHITSSFIDGYQVIKYWILSHIDSNRITFQ